MRNMPTRSGADPGAPESKRFRWKLFGIGMAAIVVGYVLLAVNNITMAPLLLVAGYCVLIPLAFL